MSAPSWAVPGAKVVCVDNSANARRHLTVGEVYTIVSCNGSCLRLKGVWDMGGPDSGWLIERFRPMVTKTIEDDVALFKHLLNTTHIGEDA